MVWVKYIDHTYWEENKFFKEGTFPFLIDKDDVISINCWSTIGGTFIGIQKQNGEKIIFKNKPRKMNKDEIELKYQEFCKTSSDINMHLPTLREYYDTCDHVTEMGVRGCVSLMAALASNAKKVVAYDIHNVWVPKVEKLTFHCADDLEVEIEETDFLFIDTLHDYDQLKAELELHAPKVRKWIGFHDTFFFARRGESGGKGLMDAIDEFLSENTGWSICYHSDENNGLTIIQK